MNLKTANGMGKYRDKNSKYDVMNYILREDKTMKGYNGVSANVDVSNIVGSMNDVAEKFGKTNGVQLRHMIMSFAPEELDDIEAANEIGRKLTEKMGKEYQAVYAVHTDKPHLHIHFVSNSVSYIDGHRYYGTKKEFYNFKKTIKDIVSKYGIKSVQYISKQSGKS